MTKKYSIIIFYSILIQVFISCSANNDTNIPNKDDKKNADSVNTNITECLKSILYYNSEVNESNYDSIATYYFHEILDYNQEHARVISARIKTIEETLSKKDKYSGITTEEQAKMSREMDSLKAVLSSYPKAVSGYVFVHTYSNGKDTISVLVVMDNHCAYGEATPIKKIFDPNPEDYSDKVRTIENY
jgi:hypothetical protein